jgi:hypothetical protein
MTCLLERLAHKQERRAAPAYRTRDTRRKATMAEPQRFADLLRLSARAHETRFVPSTPPQYHSAVATLWNLLDRNIQTHSEQCARGVGSHSACPGTPFGYMRPAQLEHYSSFVWAKGPLVYCEVGMRGLNLQQPMQPLLLLIHSGRRVAADASSSSRATQDWLQWWSRHCGHAPRQP